MKLARSGFILYVQKYRECVDFYRDIVGLEPMFSTADLTCFAFGDAYLMVEDDDRTTERKPAGTFPNCLRMTAKFVDPDGNLCALRDNDTFEQQIGGFTH